MKKNILINDKYQTINMSLDAAMQWVSEVRIIRIRVVIRTIGGSQ